MSGTKKYAEYGSESKLYGVWASMKSRCNNKSHSLYKNYGGRGISVCKEWDDYKAFMEWSLNNGYVEGNNRTDCSIDRVDVNRGYSPDNCRWVSAKEQLNNTRKNVYLSFQGETKTLSQWAARLGINYSTMCSRYSRGWSIEKMLTKSVAEKGGKGSVCTD